MNRKAFYIISLVILFFLLYLVGRPAKVIVEAGGETRADGGGILAQTRTAEELSESQIGQIDPASSTIKLATFGMRGVAISLLWHRVQEKQKYHDWNSVIALSNQLVFLEPHFTTIWEYLGWNLSYNASADFDDYRERYRWVIRGVDFLATGVEKNRLAPKLYKACGWTVSQKIGGAGSDENEQYRRLLKEDENFGLRHNCPLPSERDNWLLGRRWYRQGEDLVLLHGISLLNESDVLYFSNSRLNLFNYARWKRKDGIFGEEAIKAWENAGKEWKEFAAMDLATAVPDESLTKNGKLQRITRANAKHVKRTRLELVDIAADEIKRLKSELNAIVPSLKEELIVSRWKEIGEIKGQQGTLFKQLRDSLNWDSAGGDTPTVEETVILRKWLEKNEPDWQIKLKEDYDTLFTPEQLELMEIPGLLLDQEQNKILSKATQSIDQIRSRVFEMFHLTPRVIAEEIQEREDVPREKKSRARDITAEIEQQETTSRLARTFREIVGYDLQLGDLSVETTQQADDAHHFRYDARKAYYDGRINDSITGWLASMQKWDEVAKIKSLEDDYEFVSDHTEIVGKFLIILDKSNKIFSDVTEEPVPLKKVMWNRVYQWTEMAEMQKTALEYAEAEYKKVLAEEDPEKRAAGLEKLELWYGILSNSFNDVNSREKWMRAAPLFEVRDQSIETNAYLLKVLTLSNKVPQLDNMLLADYVDLMLLHDKNLTKAKEPVADASKKLSQGKFLEAQTALEPSVTIWKELLEKYPIVLYNTASPAFADAARIAGLYAEALKGQNKPLPADFPLKPFVK